MAKGVKIIALEEHFRTHSLQKAMKLIPTNIHINGPGSHLYD
jgi:hypothetical protein